MNWNCNISYNNEYVDRLPDRLLWWQGENFIMPAQ